MGDREVEIRALDGYLSRIPVSRFMTYRAHFVFARADSQAFVLDNLTQNERGVPLGPYYLVWDNIRNPELVAEGGAFWPYQIAKVSLARPATDSLLPGPMKTAYREHAALAQKFCLSCHRINGFGGEKYPVNLAARAKEISEARFLSWVLEPGKTRPGTTMPALVTNLAEPERRAMAKKLYAYLKALPVITASDAP